MDSSDEQDEVPLMGKSGHYEDEEERRKRKKCCIILLCLFCCIIVVAILVLLLLLYKYKVAHNTKSCYKNTNTTNMLSHDAMCMALTGQNTTFDEEENSDNIYFIKGSNNMTDQQACAVESVLRQSPDKKVYIVDFNTQEILYKTTNGHPNYLAYLLKLYKINFKVLPIDKDHFFQATPFPEIKDWNERSAFATMLVTAFRFGGMVLSTDLILNDREVIDCNAGQVLVDPSIIVVPKRCDNFIYYLIGSFALCNENYANLPLEDLIDEAIQVYTGTQSSTTPAVRRFTKDELCIDLIKTCNFLRMDECKHPRPKWMVELPHLCRHVIKAYMGPKLDELEVEKELEKMKEYLKKSSKCGVKKLIHC